MKEELRLTKRLWKAFHDLGEPEVMEYKMAQVFDREPKDKITHNNSKAKYQACIKELTDSINALNKVAPHLEIVKQFIDGELPSTEFGYDAIIKNMPTTFGLVNDFKYKKKYVAVEVNFKFYNIKTEIYTFLLHIKSKRKETWNYQTEMEYLQEEKLINPEYDYFRIGDLFKNKTDKEIQNIIISRIGKSTYKLNVDYWY